MTNDEAVQLASAMRGAGVSEFSMGGLHCKLLPPAPPPVTELAERIGELPAKQREELVNETKRQLDEDLYGAAR